MVTVQIISAHLSVLPHHNLEFPIGPGRHALREGDLILMQNSLREVYLAVKDAGIHPGAKCNYIVFASAGIFRGSKLIL